MWPYLNLPLWNLGITRRFSKALLTIDKIRASFTGQKAKPCSNRFKLQYFTKQNLLYLDRYAVILAMLLAALVLKIAGKLESEKTFFVSRNHNQFCLIQTWYFWVFKDQILILFSWSYLASIIEKTWMGWT